MNTPQNNDDISADDVLRLLDDIDTTEKVLSSRLNDIQQIRLQVISLVTNSSLKTSLLRPIIHDLYWLKEMSPSDIALYMGCTANQVRKIAGDTTQIFLCVLCKKHTFSTNFSSHTGRDMFIAAYEKYLDQRNPENYQYYGSNPYYAYRLPQFLCEECNHDIDLRPLIEIGQDEIEYLRSLPYEEYLQTKHWQQTRQNLFRLRGRQCYLCNSEASLQVHHRHYKTLGCEKPEDLVILCRNCHRKHHGK